MTARAEAGAVWLTVELTVRLEANADATAEEVETALRMALPTGSFAGVERITAVESRSWLPGGPAGRE